MVWPGAVMVKASELENGVCRFDSCNDCGVHTTASLSRQYNLVLAKGGECSVTVDLVESYGSLPLGL